MARVAINHKRAYLYRDSLKRMGARWNELGKCWMIDESYYPEAMKLLDGPSSSSSASSGQKIVNQQFDSMSEFLDFVRVPVQDAPRSYSRGTGSSMKGFSGTATFEDALDLAIKGWEDGLVKIEKYTSMFTNLIGSMLQVDEYFYDVTGQDFDLARVLQGEPESWLNTEQVQVNAPAIHTVKIVVNISASAAVSSEAIIVRGAAIASLVMLLEKARRRVEVVVLDATTTKPSDRGDILVSSITVKHAGDDLDLAKLVFAIAHPSMLRRLILAASENCKDKQLAKDICDATYGYPTDLGIADKGDIFAGKMYGNWDTEMAKQWIVDNLKGQGIELKEQV